MHVLLETLHGSQLFGTATPSSDADRFGVFLPDADDLLLGRLPGHVRDGLGADDSPKPLASKAGARDAMFSPLHLFMIKVIEGENNAIEMLFAPEWAWVSKPHPLWLELLEIRSKLISRNVRRYASFAYDQANRFGLAPRRYGAALDMQRFLAGLAAAHPEARLRDVIGEIEAFVALSAHGDAFGFADIVVNSAHPAIRHVVICSKKLPIGMRLADALGNVKALVDQYGQRTRTIASEGVDWKALSTALRVSGEAIELLEHARLTFPRPDAERLLAVKLGMVAQGEVVAEIEASLERIRDLAIATTLPEAPDAKLAEAFIRHAHATILRPALTAA